MHRGARGRHAWTDKPPVEKLPKEIDQIILDRSSKKRYLRGRFLGKGGFAKCYELTDMETKEIYAGKIVPKSKLTKPHQKEKMSMEIAIHRTLNHKGVVGFHGFFEDDDYIYILLELCRRRSLMELHKRRKALTEPEVRYYIKATVEACQYLHHKNIIHRDLKLGNLFLNEDMELKIGDFGLATKVDFDGERKKTLCGTPNYIAPEVLNKKGHSFEVDVWSLGCILYTLLVGRPPFETDSLQDTYRRIKRNEYYIPPKVSHTAQLLIIKLLRPDPTTRPSVDEILKDDFFKDFTPRRLPISSLTMAPRFATEMSEAEKNDKAEMGLASRRPLLELNSGATHQPSSRAPMNIRQGKIGTTNKRKSLGVHVIGGESVMVQPDDGMEDVKEEDEIPKDFFLADLRQQIVSCIQSKPCEKHCGEDNAEDPASTPVYWVSKWVDYSDKYGLGYQLCDNSVGVLYNDATRLLLNGNGDTLQYTAKDGTEGFYTKKGYPDELKKKVTLLEFFMSYMKDHLIKTGSDKKEEETVSSRVPFLREWFRTKHGMVLHLSNGILQINFFKDHTKIILCPRMGAVTYIDEKKNFRTYPMKNIEKYGCCSQIVTRINYAKGIIDQIREGLGV